MDNIIVRYGIENMDFVKVTKISQKMLMVFIVNLDFILFQVRFIGWK